MEKQLKAESTLKRKKADSTIVLPLKRLRKDNISETPFVPSRRTPNTSVAAPAHSFLEPHPSLTPNKRRSSTPYATTPSALAQRRSSGSFATPSAPPQRRPSGSFVPLPEPSGSFATPSAPPLSPSPSPPLSPFRRSSYLAPDPAIQRRTSVSNSRRGETVVDPSLLPDAHAMLSLSPRLNEFQKRGTPTPPSKKKQMRQTPSITDAVVGPGDALESRSYLSSWFLKVLCNSYNVTG